VPALVSIVDVFPTVLDFAGVRVRRTQQGRSLRAALTGAAIGSEATYAETLLPYATYRWASQQSLTTERWRYVRSPRPELYDRRAPDGERIDVAASHATDVARFERDLAALEARFVRRDAAPVALDPDTRRRLAALGYVVAGERGAPPAATLRDVKSMLSVKHLDGRFGRAWYRGRLTRDRALAIARKLVAASPESPPFRENLGTLLADQGRTSDAIVQFRELLRIDPSRADVRARLDALERAAARPAS
jgi:tetratricopeptide (TPR) repeat protein